MKETKVICPVCGAEIAIANHEHTVRNATVIGKDSGLGTIALPLAKDAKTSKAQDRLEALKAAGVDTSKLFAMRSANGDEQIVRMDNGRLDFLEDDDPIFRSIGKGGYISAKGLARRWVMSQMFHMLADKNWYTNEPIGFTESLKRKGYEYTWEMVVEEFRVQAKLYGVDNENFVLRNVWFNKTVLSAMMKQYLQELSVYVNGLKVKHCKRIPYKHIGGRDIFVSDIYDKIYRPLYDAQNLLIKATNPTAVYKAAQQFNARRIKLAFNTRQCPEWVDAYKGVGAYYTMKNLIQFHGCRRFSSSCKDLSLQDALMMLDKMLHDYSGEGWRMLGFLKEFLVWNNVDIEKKMAEWRKK